MATTTTKLALTKPDGTDLVDIAVLNANADKIDTASGAFICTSTTRPASPWNGQLIFETDTLNALVYRTSTTSWGIVGGSTVSENPPANAGNGNFWWDSDNGKLYIFYNDGNTSQWVSANSNTSGVPIVGNAAGRDSLYPTPAQGNSVFRNDLGYEETYYGLYNVSTNPGGKTPAGWYKAQNNVGLVPVVPTGVTVSTGSGSFNSATGVVTFTNARDINLAGIFSSPFRNYRMIINITTSASSDIIGWWTTSGTNIASNYFGATFQVFSASGSGIAQTRNPGTSAFVSFASAGAPESENIQLEFAQDFTNNRVNYTQLAYNVPNASAYFGGYGTVGNPDGFKISALTGGVTLSGTMKVYRYNE